MLRVPPVFLVIGTLQVASASLILMGRKHSSWPTRQVPEAAAPADRLERFLNPRHRCWPAAVCSSL